MSEIGVILNNVLEDLERAGMRFSDEGKIWIHLSDRVEKWCAGDTPPMPSLQRSARLAGSAAAVLDRLGLIKTDAKPLDPVQDAAVLLEKLLPPIFFLASCNLLRWDLNLRIRLQNFVIGRENDISFFEKPSVVVRFESRSSLIHHHFAQAVLVLTGCMGMGADFSKPKSNGEEG